tara:strand:+ start:270 stop:467 length:198 start_codon:yes stop_codon:yes gene_type:complete
VVEVVVVEQCILVGRQLVEVQEEEGTETQVVESLLLEVQIWVLVVVVLDGFQAIHLQAEMAALGW